MEGDDRIDSRRKALIAANAALEKQAVDVVVLDVSALSTVTNFFVIGTAESVRQLHAIADEIQENLAANGQRVWHIEGADQPVAGRMGDGLAWSLIDCGDCVIHLFNPPARTFYRLEQLWADAPRVPLDSRVAS